jgi:hypothetical protein
MNELLFSFFCRHVVARNSYEVLVNFVRIPCINPLSGHCHHSAVFFIPTSGKSCGKGEERKQEKQEEAEWDKGLFE